MALSRRHLFAAAGGVLALGAGGGAVALAGGLSPASGSKSTASAGFLGSDRIHSLGFTVDPQAVVAAVRTFKSSGTKDWLTASVSIDGVAYNKVGIRLKGNSSLRSASESTPPQSLPWLVRLDKYVQGTNHGGMTDLVVRSNTSATSLNEAVALDLLGAAGLATQQSAYVKLSANGSAEALRLVIENPGDTWAARVFPTDGLLYKAEAGGDWTYRGAAASAYEDVFDQESGKADLSPLIRFLEFVNTASDADFASGLSGRLDVDAFATYLAFEELVDNFDDIDGPGNNAYLWWARPTSRMTVVAWDHNLAFGARPGMGGAGGQTGGRPDEQAGAAGGRTQPQGQPPAGGPAGGPGGGPVGQAGGQGGGRGPAGKANPLVTRYTALLGGADKVATAKETLRQKLYGSGLARQRLQSWSSLLEKDAALVPSATLSSERQAIERYVT